MQETDKKTPTLRDLWAQFLPLSLSDIAMAAGDPLVTTTLAHLSGARANLAALGVAKALAVFFESPIIMLLHTSTTMAPSAVARRALWKFMLWAIGVLACLVGLLTVPAIFDWVGQHIFGIEAAILDASRWTMMLFIAWPALIGWRRYHQGLLIHAGKGGAVARAGFARLFMLAAVLAVGFWAGWPGWLVGGGAMIVALAAETVLATYWARQPGVVQDRDPASVAHLPTDVNGIVRFYWPLANSMLVVWAGRALLLGIVARAADGSVALAAWPAAWGFVMLLTNGTRMIQQVIIRNRGNLDGWLLLKFTCSVGLAFSTVLAIFGFGPWREATMTAFVGQDAGLVAAVLPVVRLSIVMPFIIAVQNACQGLLIATGDTRRINLATWLGTAVLLFGAFTGVKLGLPGSTAAVGAMLAALVAELLWLMVGLKRALPTFLPSRQDSGAGECPHPA